MQRLRRYQVWILAGLLLVFGGLFVVRGPARALYQGADLAHLYAASALWANGGNPYDGEQCVGLMEQAGYPKPGHVSNGSFYPPPTLAVMAPLGMLGWEAARLVWLVVNLLGCAALVWALAAWLGFEQAWLRWSLATLIVLAWGPIATALSLGQLSIAAAAGVFAGLVLMQRGKAGWAGLLIALGCLIKPQLGLGFLLLVALHRQWRALLIASVLIAGVSALGVGRLMLTAPGWAGELASNIANDQASGNVLDASLQGPLRYQMIDLRPLLHLVLPRAWVNLSALFVVAVLAGLALWKLMRAGLSRYALLAASGVGLLMLLPVYHRYYDAVLLMPLLALVVNALVRDRSDRLMGVIALAMLPLVQPLPSLLAVLHQKGVIPEALHASWPWQQLVLQHQSWCLLIAAIVLVVWTIRRVPGQGTDPATSMAPIPPADRSAR